MDNSILWISKLCSCVSVRWCVIDIIKSIDMSLYDDLIIFGEELEFQHRLSGS